MAATDKNIGKIVYRFTTPVYPGDILYVNPVPQYSCTNDCLFCSRPRTENEFGLSNIYEKKARTSLYLETVPSVDNLVAVIKSTIKPADKELAIIGLGEPLLQFDKVISVLQYVKKALPYLKTRIDTNGLVGCWDSDAVSRLVEAGLDEIRISLNATSAEEYCVLCRPKVEPAFETLVSFVQECNSSCIDTKVSFVVGFKSEEATSRTAEEYILFAESLGIQPNQVILRTYVDSIMEV